MDTRRLVIAGTASVLTLVALLLAGCDDGYSRSYSVTTATPSIPALNPTLQPTADALALDAYQTAQALDSQARIAEMTMSAAQEQAERQYQMLTAEAQMTAEVHQREMAKLSWQATATAGERAYQATTTAQIRADSATATVAAWQFQSTVEAITATRRAEATASAMAFQATATRQAWEARATSTAESVQGTRSAYQATVTRQAEQREAVLGYGRDYGIPVMLLVAAAGIGALVVYGIRQYAKRPVVIQRDLRGDAPSLALPSPGGGWNLVDLDRQPGHVTRLLPSGDTLAPQFRSAGQEERTTARDQLVDATTRPRLGTRKGNNGQQPMLPVTPPPRPPVPGLRSVRVLRRLDQAGTAGFLPGPLLASLQADWEEEQ